MSPSVVIGSANPLEGFSQFIDVAVAVKTWLSVPRAKRTQPELLRYNISPSATEPIVFKLANTFVKSVTSARASIPSSLV
jgi:hypothetical protein